MQLTALLAAEVAATAALHGLGAVPWLRVPWSDLPRWLATAPPAEAVAAASRSLALALAWWVLATTVAHVAAALSRVPSAVAATGRAALPVVRRAVAAALAGSVVATPVAAAPLGPPVPASELGHPPAVSQPAEVPAAPAGRPSGRAAEHVVRSGDSLWSVAAATVGDGATTAEVAAYWVRLVDANRSRLRSGDPDLVHPGELIVLPPRG